MFKKNTVTERNNTGTENAFTVIAKSRTPVGEQLRQRGLTMVDQKKKWETPVKVEFNIDKQTIQFNIRAELLVLLQKMMAVDPTLKIQSTLRKDLEWDSLENVPEDTEFNDSFKVQDFTYRKLRKVVAHMTLITTLHVNQIKYRENVKEHLFQNNIWFKPDRFDTKIESSPGIIIMLHPKLINRDDFKEEVTSALTEAVVTLEEGTAMDEENDSGTIDGQKLNKNRVPSFYLETSVKKWRDLKVEVLRINSAKEDSEYLKFLLSTSSEQGQMKQGVFLPEGLHLMEGKELVYTMLRRHSQYMNEITGIPLSGLKHSDLALTLPNERQTISEIITGINGVLSIERIKDRKRNGNLLVVTKKRHEAAVLDTLANRMETIYKCQIGQRRIILAGSCKIHNPDEQVNRVSTYAEILSSRYRPPASAGSNIPSTQTTKGQLPSEEKQMENSESKASEKSIEEKNDHQRDLLGRIDEMASKQATLEKAHEKLQKDHHELKKIEDKQYKREDNLQTDTVNKMIETKLSEFKESNEKQLQAAEIALKSEIGKSIDRKIQNISDTVAHNVSTQILEAFHQYMNPPKYVEGDQQYNRIFPPRITQETSPAVAHRVRESTSIEDLRRPALVAVEQTVRMQSDMIEAENCNTKCSPHDNYSEQNTVT